ncbi:MAG: hypothetical protein HY343_09575, partial [Lentisphaerae bacterium]|nr:hypothetical protein [Lentisphaerota bacterium]
MPITLDEIVRDVERQGPYPDAAQLAGLLNDPDREKRSVGLLLKAGACFRSGDEIGAFRELLRSRAVLGGVPLEIMANIVWLGLRLNRAQEAAFECLEFARWAASIQAFDLALEACFGGLLLDQKGAMEILRTPRLALEVADFYEQIARRLQPGGEPPASRSAEPTKRPTLNNQHPMPNRDDSQSEEAGQRPAPQFDSVSQSPQSKIDPDSSEVGAKSKIENRKSKILVALVVPNLVDDIVAYSKRVQYFARYLDPEKYRLHVYSTENFSGRENPLFPYHCARYSTEQTGKNIIAELKERGVPVTLGTRQAPFAAAARELAGKLEQDGIQIVVFQGGLACPIDWLVARWSRVPLKAAIHIGSSMLVPGMDVTFFDNAVNIEREKDWWPPNVGERAVLRKGADIEELDRQPAHPRALWNIPDDAVVIGLL